MDLRRFPAAALVLVTLGCADSAPAPPPRDDSTIFSARSGPAPKRVSPLAKIEPAPPRTFGPFTIDSVAYTAVATRFLTRQESSVDTGTASVEIRDARQRVVYAVRIMSDSEMADGWWTEVGVSPLEDASGRARALMIFTSSNPSAPATGEGFSVVAPRGDSLRQLFAFDWFGNSFSMGASETKNGSRLLPGDRMESSAWMYFYEAMVPVHVSLDCEPASQRCLDIALPDSIAGLARFAVTPSTPRPTDSTAIVELFDAPLAAHGTSVTVPKGATVEVLGGAGKVDLGRSDGVQRVHITDDWLLVRVDGHTGWITGDAAYKAVGLWEAG